MIAAAQPRTRVPSQDRAVKTRAALVAAAAREFSTRGYAAATAKTIAARARAATGSFYQYFTSKDELLREVASARQAELIAAVLGELERPTPAGADAGAALVADVRQRMRTVIDAAMAYHVADPGLHAVVTERRHTDPALDALITEAERALIARIAALLTRWRHPGDALATAFVLFGAVEGAVHAHVLGSAVVDDARFADALLDALITLALPHR